ncbi:MAG TPA: hypothetical protein VFI97_05745 [Arthrobacter sp.]|nr:hypothetical protein [Arthrobacter sp.]
MAIQRRIKFQHGDVFPAGATPVEFKGLTALPYVDDNGMRPRIAWSYRADNMVAPSNGSSTSPSAPGKGAA